MPFCVIINYDKQGIQFGYMNMKRNQSNTPHTDNDNKNAELMLKIPATAMYNASL